MKRNSISSILMVVTPTLVVCVVLALGASAAAQEPIQGSWIFVVTPPPGAGSPFSAIASFAAGGVFLATGENDRAVAPVSEVHGNWQRIGRNRYGSTQYLFAFDSAGHAVGMLRNQWVFRMTSKNELGGPGTLSLCDIHGENCTPVPGVGSITGRG
jgi:hypothetical protein